jgi:hypothetical protein
VKALGRLALVAATVVATYYATLRVAEHKADALAGGGTFRLDRAHAEEEQAFHALLGQLGQWHQTELAEGLLALREPPRASGRGGAVVRVGGGLGPAERRSRPREGDGRLLERTAAL